MKNEIVLKDKNITLKKDDVILWEEKFEYFRYAQNEVTIMFNDFKHFIVNSVKDNSNYSEYKFSYSNDEGNFDLIIL